MWTTIQDAVGRFLGFGTQPLPAISVGGGRVTEVRPSYPVRNSMQAFAAFPYVRACVQAISTDLAGLPLIATDYSGSTPKSVGKHPALRAFQNPNSKTTERRLRRQLYVDYSATGNAFLLAKAAPGLSQSPMYRLHPGLVAVEVDGMGLPASYKYNERDRYELDQVLHIADTSWEDTVEQCVGASAILTLHHDLLTLKSAKQHAAKSAKRGQPDMLITPADDKSGLGKGGAKRITDAVEEQLREGKSAIAFGEALKVTPLSLTMRDMEFQKLQETTTQAILAVFNVPPVRVGLSGANYGTAKTQMRAYWEWLRQIATLFDDEFSRLAGGGVRIEHDFTAVEALQVSYSERMDRVKSWVEVGSTPYQAAIYEGFLNPPVAENAEPRSSQMRPGSAKEPEEPQGTKRAATLADDLETYLDGACVRYDRALRFAGGDGSRCDLTLSEAPLLADVLGSHLGSDCDRIALSASQAIADAVVAHLIERAADGVEVLTVRGLTVFGGFYARTLSEHLERAA